MATLAKANPEKAKLWHPTRNGNLTPYDVDEGSSRLVWWQCTCGYEYMAQVKSNFDKNPRCPHCNKNVHYYVDGTTARHSITPKIVNVDTGEVFATATDAALFYGLDVGPINACCKRGLTATANGYHWKYVFTKKDIKELEKTEKPYYNGPYYSEEDLPQLIADVYSAENTDAVKKNVEMQAIETIGSAYLEELNDEEFFDTIYMSNSGLAHRIKAICQKAKLYDEMMKKEGK